MDRRICVFLLLCAGSGGANATTVSAVELPIRFEPNVGQATTPVEYVARGDGYSVALTQRGVILDLRRGMPRSHGNPGVRADRTASAGATIRLTLIRASANSHLRAEQHQDSVSNYFIGNDPSKWHSQVPNYGAVRYEQVYPGIDWVVYGNPQQLEYDFVVAPRADPRRIALKFEGADGVSLDNDGNLLVKAHGTVLRQIKPVIYQAAADGVRRNIDGRYVLGRRHFVFELGDYDHDRQLIIDPAFVYSTYLGGSNGQGNSNGNTNAAAIAVDAAGNAYIAGATSSTNFPTQNPLQAGDQSNPGTNVFITKFNPTGTAIVYSTYLGGTAPIGDGATAIAVDASGNAYVAGYANSTDFPTVNPYQAVNRGGLISESNAFITKINPTGTALVYSTYLGGTGGSDFPNEGAEGIAVDSGGNAYVVGMTTSTDFPTVNAFQETTSKSVPDVAALASHVDATGSPAVPCACENTTVFVTKLNASGSSLAYSTYLGGRGNENLALAVAVDGSGSAYVVGQTTQTDFPVVAAFQSTNHSTDPSGLTGFVTKFSPAGDALVYSTYLGGSGVDTAAGVALDDAGSAYVVGSTSSKDFPVTHALQGKNQASGETAFIAKFNPSGSGLTFATYLGGSSADMARGVAADGAGNTYVTGVTYSTDFPSKNPLQSSNNGVGHNSGNAFISMISADGSALDFSTYLGGSGSCEMTLNVCGSDYLGDYAGGIAVDSAGNIYVAGSTHSTDFPTAAAFQNIDKANYNGAGWGFVTKISVNAAAAAASTGGVVSGVGNGGGGGGGAMGWGFIVLLGVVVAARPRSSLT